MKRVIANAVLVVLSMLSGAYAIAADNGAGEPSAQASSQKPTLVINLTSGETDLHAVVMGLHFAEHGLADGREVVVFFNVKSPPLAKKDLADGVGLEGMPPIKEMIATLLKGGAKMVVCPMCAEIMGVKASELGPGIKMIEDRKQIFDHLHANTVVFTY